MKHMTRTVRRRCTQLVLATALAASALATQASVVLIQDGQVFNETALDTFYDAQPGVSSSVISGGTVLDAATLAGVDLFVASTPANAYSGSELAALDAFVNGGGTALLMAEHQGFTTAINTINALMTQLGSTISITPAAIGGGGSGCSIGTETGAALVGPLMTGVGAFTWGCGSIVNGGVTEMLEQSLTSPIIASEAIGAGHVVVIGDGNVSATTAGNRQFFLNVLALQPSPVQAPAPASVMLLGAGLVLLGFSRRRR